MVDLIIWDWVFQHSLPLLGTVVTLCIVYFLGKAFWEEAKEYQNEKTKSSAEKVNESMSAIGAVVIMAPVLAILGLCVYCLFR